MKSKKGAIPKYALFDKDFFVKSGRVGGRRSALANKKRDPDYYKKRGKEGAIKRWGKKAE